MTKGNSQALQLGSAVARTACQLWAGPAAEIALTVADIFASRTSDLIEQRRARRAFDRIGEELAERMGRYIDIEYRGLPENEILAAISTASTIFESVPLDPKLVLDADLSAVPIQDQLRSVGAATIRRAALSEPASEFFDRLLTDCCNYVLEIVISLPNFESAALQELLKRESAIIDLMQEVLDRLPASTKNSGPGEQSREFDIEYKRQLLRRLDFLELFGVDLAATSRRYALSVAYVSLDVNTQVSPRPSSKLGEASRPSSDTGESEDEEARASQRVESALAQHSRTLLRGEAGSGKTTLLRWIAVRAARSDFSGELSSWNGRVPFLIELRRFVGKDLPNPEDFASSIAGPSIAMKPASWVTDKLRQGDCLLLVDGMDELPTVERSKAKDWLRSLVDTFPTMTYVVTSRPAAVSGEWLRDLAFTDQELQPMTPDDIDAFVERWHVAVFEGASTESSSRDEFEDLENSLKTLIRRTPSVRNLATTPLLCAMLCGLNRDRRKQLPHDRLGLYRVALESLLERRDAERRVTADAVEFFGLSEKLLILQDLAYWLLINGQSSAEKEQAKARFASKLDNMPRLNSSPHAILRHMLIRSGVLREPAEGKIDFIHRTFLEYLAAAEVIEQDSIGLLVSNAHLDQWREVIVLAAGHASRPRREHLISELLARALNEPEYQHVLQLLAVACLETSPELSTEIQERLNSALVGLLPPSSLSDARSLASAGDLAAPLLRRQPNWYVNEAVAAVRCLALIGTDSALDALSSFKLDSRVMVCRELLRAWSAFDTRDYAQRVLSQNKLDYGRVDIVDPTLLYGVGELQQLKYVKLSTGSKHVDTNYLKGLPFVIIEVRDNNTLTNLDWLDNSSQLVFADFSGCKNLEDVWPLGGPSSLRTLDLSGTGSIVRSPDFSQLTDLERLFLDDCAWLSDLSFSKFARRLRVLSIANNSQIADLTPLAGNPELMDLNLRHASGIREFRTLGNLPGLRFVDASHTGIRTLRTLAQSERLTQLDCSWTPLASLEGLEAVDSLSSLEIEGCVDIRDLEPLSEGTRPIHLDIRKTGITDLSPLSNRSKVTVWSSVPEDEMNMPRDVPEGWNIFVF